jgi:hypothetical protein
MLCPHYATTKQNNTGGAYEKTLEYYIFIIIFMFLRKLDTIVHLLSVKIIMKRKKRTRPAARQFHTAADTGQKQSGYRKADAHPIAMFFTVATGYVNACSSFAPHGDRGPFRRF